MFIMLVSCFHPRLTDDPEWRKSVPELYVQVQTGTDK